MNGLTIMRYPFFLLLGLILLTGCASTPVTVEQSALPPDNDNAVNEETVESIPEQEAHTEETKQVSEDRETETEQPPLISPKLTMDSLDPGQRRALVDHLLKGTLLEQKKQYDEAGSEYTQALEILPDSSYVGALTSETLLKSGKLDEAVQIAQGVIGQASDETAAYRVLGEVNTQRRQWSRAIENYETIVRLEPSSLDDWAKLASLYVREKRFEDAISAFRTLERLNRIHAVLYRFKVAMLLTRLERFEDSLKEYQSIIQLAPDYHEAYVRAAQLQELLGKNDEAIETYLTSLNAVRTKRDELEVRKRLGILFRQRGSLQEACHQYRRIKELDPDDLSTRTILAFLLYNQGTYEDAFSEVNALTLKKPGRYQIASLRRQILEKLNRAPDGILDFLKAFDHAIEEKMEGEVNLFLLDFFRETTLKSISEYLFMTDLKKRLDSAKKRLPKIPRISFAQAHIALYMKDNVLLQQQLKAVIDDLHKAKADNQQLWIDLICLEIRSWYPIRDAFARHGLAMDLTDALSEGDPVVTGRPEMAWTLGVVYMSHKDWYQAETALSRALDGLDESSQSFKDVVFQLALVYDKLNRIADIERLMQASMASFPDDAQAFNFLGYTYADRDIRLSEALALIEKALKIRPDDGNIIDSLGWVNYRLGRNSEAVEYLRRALELEKNHPVILDHLADAYAREGEFALALENWRKALEFGPEFPFEFTPEFQAAIEKKIEENETATSEKHVK